VPVESQRFGRSRALSSGQAPWLAVIAAATAIGTSGCGSSNDDGGCCGHPDDTGSETVVDAPEPDAPHEAADVRGEATDDGSGDVDATGDESSAPVTCTSADGGGPPCSMTLGGCSDGHTYSIVCDGTSCVCEVDGVPNGKTTTEAVCEGLASGWNAPCGFNLL
jgi:hypothetical protein